MKWTHSIDQSINQSINQPTNQPTNQPISQPINQSVNQSVNQLINQPISQSINQVDWLTDWLIVWLVGWLVGQLTDWLTDWLVGWLIDWLIGYHFRIVPESARWLVIRGRLSEAEDILSDISMKNGIAVPKLLLQVSRPLASFGKKYGCLDLICSRKVAKITLVLTYLW